MTRRGTIPPTGSEVSRLLDQPARQRPTPSPDIDVVRHAVDLLTDRISNACFEAVRHIIEDSGLRFRIGTDAIHRALQEYVYDNIVAELHERVTDIKAEPSLIARLSVKSTRDTLVELIAEFEQE